MFTTLLTVGYAAFAAAHSTHDQETLAGPHQSLWYNTLPGDGGTQVRPPQIPSYPTQTALTVDLRRTPYSLESLLSDVYRTSLVLATRMSTMTLRS